MVDFNKIIENAVAYELVDGQGYKHYTGTLDECFTVMVNLYGDAVARRLFVAGVAINPVKKG